MKHLPTATSLSAKRNMASRVSPARNAALAALNTVRTGVFVEEALGRVLDSMDLSPEDRGLATELAYGVLRWRQRLDAIIQRCLSEPRKKLRPQFREILRLALYQIAFLDRVPVHAAVNDAVNQARKHFDVRTASLANAVLRNALRSWDRVDPAPSESAESLATYYSHPRWLVEHWLSAWGPDVTRTILSHNNSRAMLTVRANSLRTSRDTLLALLQSEGVDATPTIPDPDALQLAPRRPVHRISSFEAGLFAVQDSASQMIAPLLGVNAGHRVLDACAAPGGKTAHLAALAGNRAEIISMDSHPSRLEEARKNLTRLGVENVKFVMGNARKWEDLKGLGLFDRILLDAPCTNLGVLRHNPDAKYRAQPEDPGNFAETQLEMLLRVSKILKPGGKLLYSVCTVTAEETVEVVEKFLNVAPDYAVDRIHPSEVPSPRFLTGRGYFFTFPPSETERVDGFFAARFSKV